MKKKKKVAGWSTKAFKEVTSRRENEDTEEMVQWKSINQEEVENLWKVLSRKMEEEVLPEGIVSFRRTTGLRRHLGKMRRFSVTRFQIVL